MRWTNPTRLTAIVIVISATIGVSGQQQPRSPAQSIRRQFEDVNQRLLEMARDFPEAKYQYRPGPGVRSFPEVIVHAMSGNVYAAKIGRGEKANWDELDAKSYTTREQVVTALQKSITEATDALKRVPDERFTQTLEPWLSVIEHSAEHYGQLVTYYRANGLVPPASRK